MGDSLTAGLAGNGRGGFTCAAQGNRPLSAAEQSSCTGGGAEGVGGWQPSLKQLSGTNVYNHGNSGNQTSQILARLSAAMAANQSTHVLILAGTNDTIRGSVSGATANIKAMINQVLDANRTPIVGTIPPLAGSVVGGFEPRVRELNDAIRALPDEFPGLVIVELYNNLLPNWAQNTSGDFIHLGTTGNTLVADLWWQGIQASIVSAPKPPLSSISSLLLDED